MDLSEFRTIRSPRPPAPESARPQSVVAELDGPLVADIERLLPGGTGKDVDRVVTEFRAARQDPRDVDRANPDTAWQVAYSVIGGVSDWLEARDDRVPGRDWGAVADKRADPHVTRIGEEAWRQALTDVGGELASWIVASLHDRDLAAVADFTRLWGVRRLLVAPNRDSYTAADTAAFLHAQAPVLREELRRVLVPQARVELVREASVADLYVVRSEWRAYLLGDVAKITNVLPGEVHRHVSNTVTEDETTATSESTTTTRTEESTESETQSELSSETQTQLRAEINGHLRADVQQSWGSGSVKVSGGIEGRLSLDQSQRQASRIARRAVDKAVSTVDNMTREARTRRSLSRVSETVDDRIDNTDGETVRGVYRWLDRVDRFQVYRYPERLQLEFQLPEPAEYLRHLARRRGIADDAAAPPPWDLTAEDITPTTDLLTLASRFRATGLPALPAASVSVVQAVKAEAKGERGTPAKLEDAVAVPIAIDELELLVPPGYEATKLDFAGFAAPAWGRWVGEKADGSTWDRQDGWHGAVFSVMVGELNHWASNQVSGNMAKPDDAVPRTLGTDVAGLNKQPRFGNAFVELTGDATTARTVTFDPPAVGKVKITVQAAGSSAAHLAVTMTCARTAEAEQRWRQEVFDALFDAWSAWRRQHDADRDRAAELELIAGGGSAARVQQLVRDEIKRQVIAWLLGPEPFRGMDALLPADAGGPPTDGRPADDPDDGMSEHGRPRPARPRWRDIDFDRARATAPTIEFLEQAFEWGNMAYICYPYYWADRSRWDELQQLQHPNPDMERFLKAGSARVVVPARPALAGAVQNWLVYQEPFFGRPLPVPGEKMFVSVAQEIRDLTEPPADGVPGESWEARTGTTLLWLDDSGELPVNERGVLGAAPHTPVPLLSGPTP